MRRRPAQEDGEDGVGVGVGVGSSGGSSPSSVSDRKRRKGRWRSNTAACGTCSSGAREAGVPPPLVVAIIVGSSIIGLWTLLALVRSMLFGLSPTATSTLGEHTAGSGAGRIRGASDNDIPRTDTTGNTGNIASPATITTMYAIGLVRDMAEIRPEILKWLAEVNCRYGVGLHIVTSRKQSDQEYADVGLNKYRPAAAADADAGCAQVIIAEENASEIYGEGEVHVIPSNRVERIAALRDYQRDLLRPYFDNTGNGGKGGGALIVIDLDLAALPPPSRVMAVARQLAVPPSSATFDVADADVGTDIGDTDAAMFPYDVICAAGVTAANRNELWYYDTYATVLLPDTYIHPLQRRKIKSHYPGEDPTLVRSDNRNGNWTQGDIMRYLQQQGRQSKYGTVDVRSCFGGMAMYRASTYLDKSCRYGLDPTGLERYATDADGRPCEHVVYHDCLVRTADHGTAAGSAGRIAIMPQLVTLWKKYKR